MKKILIVVAAAMIGAMIACGTAISVIGGTAPVTMPTFTPQPTNAPKPTAVPDPCGDLAVELWMNEIGGLTREATPYREAALSGDFAGLLNADTPNIMRDFASRAQAINGPTCTQATTNELASGYQDVARAFMYADEGDLENGALYLEQANTHFANVTEGLVELLEILNAGN